MNTSIHLALWEWFAQCAAITKLFFNFSGTEDADTVISTSGDVVMESYIDDATKLKLNPYIDDEDHEKILARVAAERVEMTPAIGDGGLDV